jgi:hypothetical protein
LKGDIIEFIGIGIVENTVATYTIAEAINSFEVCLNICAPLGLRPTVSALLNTSGGFHGIHGRAISLGRIYIIS